MILRRSAVLFIAFTLIATIMLASCGGGGDDGGSGADSGGSPAGNASGGSQSGSSSGGGDKENPEPQNPRDFPPSELLLPQESGETIENDGAVIDYGNAADGYIMAWCTEPFDTGLKMLIVKDGQQYAYDMPSDGSVVTFPLNMGDGEYEMGIYWHDTGTSYYPTVTTSDHGEPLEVTLNSEYAPFMIPMQLIYYDETSECVKKAWELAEGKKSDIEVVSAIYDFVSDNITYDKEKAVAVQTEQDYIPSPDETLATGTGICYDYASLAAAMLRANGIPTKLITGNVAPDGIYHAWNDVYLENEGWIGASIEVNDVDWKRIDTTFAASLDDDTMAQFVGNGDHYQIRLVY